MRVNHSAVSATRHTTHGNQSDVEPYAWCPVVNPGGVSIEEGELFRMSQGISLRTYFRILTLFVL